jgi:hypothetical protein
VICAASASAWDVVPDVVDVPEVTVDVMGVPAADVVV